MQEELNGTPDDPEEFPDPMVFSWWDFEHAEVFLLAEKIDQS